MNQEEKRYRTNPDFLLREIAGDAILVPVGDSAAQFNGMISVNETFRFLWELFQEPHTVGEAVEAAAKEFDGAPAVIEEDIRAYVSESIQYGILLGEKEGEQNDEKNLGKTTGNRAEVYTE